MWGKDRTHHFETSLNEMLARSFCVVKFMVMDKAVRDEVG